MKSTTDQMDEQKLLIKLKDGDHNAFNTLFKRYSPVITGHLIRMLKSQELVEEVVQDTFMKLWEHRDRVDEQLPIKRTLFIDLLPA